MNKKFTIVGAIILVAIIGFFYYQEYISKPNVIMEYIEETNHMVEQYNALYELESEVLEDEEELFLLTKNTIVPKLKEIHSESVSYGNTIKNTDLKAIHDLHTEALELYINAEEAWLSGEEFEDIFMEGDELYSRYETDFEAFANKMNVELEWE